MIWIFATTNPQGLPGMQKTEDNVELFYENANHSGIY